MSLGRNINARRAQARAEEQQSPDAVNARIIRAQWEDWENRFRPIQQMAFATVTDPAEQLRLDNEALTNSGDAADAAFDRADERLQTLASRSPQKTTDPQVQKARARQLTLGRRGSKVDAYNNTQVALGDRELQRIAG